MSIRSLALAVSFAAAAQSALAFGEEGHSIVAEIAQRRLDPAAQVAVLDLIGGSLSSVASWADDVKGARPETARWHFVDIPLSRSQYDEGKDCAADPRQGDCVVKELARLEVQLRCAGTVEERRDALRFAVHLVGDIHQPLHTVEELTGGNGLRISGTIHGSACGKDGCNVKDYSSNLHAFWDTGLIRITYYDWGAYVQALEDGMLRSSDVIATGAQTDPRDWAVQTHGVAQQVWNNRVIPPNGVLGDDYYKMAMPLLDRQLAVAGLRLAGFLNRAYSSGTCESTIAPRANLGELKADLIHYYSDPVKNGKSQYEVDQESVIAEALAYMNARLPMLAPSIKPAIVLDIDETSLDNYEQMKINDFGYIRLGPCTLQPGHACATDGDDGWTALERGKPIRATLGLFLAALDKHVAVFFVTGRSDIGGARSHTESNLRKAGYHDWADLKLRPTGAAAGANVAEYKAAERAKIEASGYTILMNIGDQRSDLAGGHGERMFKMPNPFYYLP